jgi:hypothetical protein
MLVIEEANMRNRLHYFWFFEGLASVALIVAGGIILAAIMIAFITRFS